MIFDDQPPRWQIPLLWMRQRLRAAGHRVAELAAAVIWPVERLIAAVTGKFFDATERVEQIESLLLYVVYGLTWPFTALYRALRALANAVIPPSVQRVLALPFHFLALIAYRLADAAVRLGDSMFVDSVLLWITWLLRPLWYPFAAIGNFVVAWAATRPLKKLLWGLPAFVIVVPLAAVLAHGILWGDRGIASRYRLAVQQSLEQKDYRKAQLFERKLAQLGVDTKLAEFHLAQALERDGRIIEAYERMQRLAPVDAPGYPQAHFWIIQRLLTEKIQLPEKEVHRLVGAHLTYLETMAGNDPQLNVIRAVWLSQENRLQEAADLLEPLVHKIPSAAIERFRINLVLKQADDARQDALAVRDHMERQIRAGTSLTSADFKSWATAEELLASNTRFREVLRHWIKQDPKDKVARRSLAALYLREFDQIVRSPNPNPDELVIRVRDAFALDDVPDDVRQRVALLYQQRTMSEPVAVCFQKLIESPELPAALAETLGTAAAVENDWPRAQACLERAVAGDPGNAVSWNNLACVLLNTAEPDLQKALAASEKALELAPDDHRYRETHGQILLRLGRPQEAVADLEFALNAMPDVPSIHRSLAKAYAELGNDSLAAIHQQHAE